jgi:hypothetical protein
VVGRLVAALGQAMLYTAVNNDHAQIEPRLDARQAAEAVTGLGLVLQHRPPGEDLVAVDAQVVAWTRATLEVLRDQLRAGAWSSCPCGELHDQVDTDVAVLRAVSNDLLPAAGRRPPRRLSAAAPAHGGLLTQMPSRRCRRPYCGVPWTVACPVSR